MTVSQINKNQIKITLTNIEVLGCFGTYERLYGMSKNIKSSLNALVREILEDYAFYKKNSKIIAKIKVKKHIGCEIILSSIQNRYSTYNHMIFEFTNSENLTRGILLLYKNKENKNLKSSLYKINNTFRLIIYSDKNLDRFFIMNEFCYIKSNCETLIAYTEEYGKLLIKNNAIHIYGQAFSSQKN